jgi:uncharacterized protein YcbK (DUF882 family)
MRNLNAKIPGAENFTYREIVRSDTALRLGIANAPTEEQWRRAEILAQQVLQPVRNRFGRIRITSWFRSPDLCHAIGSSRTSNHTTGGTADIEPIEPGVTLLDVLTYIHDTVPFRELIAEYLPTGWVHVAYQAGANDGVIKLKDANHHYSRVTLAEIKGGY